VDIEKLNFTLSQNFTEKVKLWVYSTSGFLLNTQLEVTLLYFVSASSIAFGNSSLDFPGNTLKFMLNISDWPFLSYKNMLRVVLQTAASGETSEHSVCQQQNFAESENGNLLWYRIYYNGLTLYGQFLDYAILDYRAVNIQYILADNNGTIFIILPHFWYNALIDPDFSLLVDPDENSPCSVNSFPNDIWWIAVTCIGAVAIVIVSLVLVLKKVQKHKRNAERKKRTSANTELLALS